jgi:hypothetical protein
MVVAASCGSARHVLAPFRWHPAAWHFPTEGPLPQATSPSAAWGSLARLGGRRLAAAAGACTATVEEDPHQQCESGATLGGQMGIHQHQSSASTSKHPCQQPPCIANPILFTPPPPHTATHHARCRQGWPQAQQHALRQGVTEGQHGHVLLTQVQQPVIGAQRPLHTPSGRRSRSSSSNTTSAMVHGKMGCPVHCNSSVLFCLHSTG